MFIQLLSLPSYVYPVLNSVCIPVQIKLTFISMHKFESSGCVHSFLSSSYHVFIPIFSLSLGVPDSVPVRQRARVRKQCASSYRQDVEPGDSLQETHPTQKGRSVTAYSEFKRKQEEWLSVYYAEHFVLQLYVRTEQMA